MKIVKAQIDILKHVLINEADPDRDSLYEDVKSSNGKKIVSQAKTLDQSLLDNLKKKNVDKIWVKRKFPQWVFANQARERNLNTLSMKQVEVPHAKAIKELSAAKNAGQLNQFLKQLHERATSDRTQYKIKEIIEEIEGLLPTVKAFREKLMSIENDKKRQEIVELLHQQPDEIGLVDFPNSMKRFMSKYMNYVCKLEKLRYRAANIILNMDENIVDEFLEKQTV